MTRIEGAGWGMAKCRYVSGVTAAGNAAGNHKRISCSQILPVVEPRGQTQFNLILKLADYGSHISLVPDTKSWDI